MVAMRVIPALVTPFGEDERIDYGSHSTKDACRHAARRRLAAEASATMRSSSLIEQIERNSPVEPPTSELPTSALSASMIACRSTATLAAFPAQPGHKDKRAETPPAPLAPPSPTSWPFPTSRLPSQRV